MADGGSLQIPATLVIDPEVLRVIITDAVKVAMNPVARGPEPEQDEAPPAKVRKPRAKKVEPEPGPEKVLRIRVDPNLPFVQQVHAVIVDAALQAHGDAIARSIMNQWTAAADSGVEVLRAIYPAVTLELIGAAVSDAQEATLKGLPQLFLNGIFAVANEYASKATKTKVCGVCEGVEAHKPGCPALMAERRGVDEGGGAIPSRVPNPTIPAPKPNAAPEGEVCNHPGGPGAGCPIPQHATIRQGGAHIWVHPPEIMATIRAATTAAADPTPGWSAPPPPGAARPPAAPKAKRGRVKKAKS